MLFYLTFSKLPFSFQDQNYDAVSENSRWSELEFSDDDERNNITPQPTFTQQDLPKSALNKSKQKGSTSGQSRSKMAYDSRLSLQSLSDDEDEDNYPLPPRGKTKKEIQRREKAKERLKQEIMEFQEWWGDLVDMRRRVRKKKPGAEQKMSLADRIMQRRHQEQVCMEYSNIT